MRINKFIASCGVASRRKAEELILNGKVKVNDKIANIVSLVIASVGKFIFLSFAATKLIVWLNLGVAPKILEKLAVAMGVAQLYAALAGGILAIVLGGILIRINAKSNK